MVPEEAQTIALLFAGGMWAGAQNALAGGGSFVTLPVLMLTGLDARLANLTSTVALFPGQLAAGYRGRGMIGGEGPLGRPPLVAISVCGGAIGAGLLLATPSDFFARFVPWLILFATAIFIIGGGRSRRARRPTLGARTFGVVHFVLAVYGGYFGGGGSFLLLAALSLAGFAARSAAAFKNILLALINAAAVLVFVSSGEAVLGKAVVLGAGALVGSIAGVSILRRIDETFLRFGVAAIGVTLTLWLFASAP